MKVHNRNPATISSYRSAIKTCLDRLAEDGRPTDALRIRQDDFYFISRKLLEEGTESRAKQYLSAFSTFCKRHGGIDGSKVGLMWNPIQTNPSRITPEDFAKLYRNADPVERLILVLGGSMGLRREEMARIRMEDITEDGIIVHGKGHGSQGKVAVQQMTDIVRKELCVYLSVYHRRKGQYLLTWNRAADDDFASEKCRVECIGRKVARMSMVIGKRVTPHALRRLFATMLDREGVPIDTICDLMRHSSPNVTKIYIEKNLEEMTKASSIVSDVMTGLVGGY